MYCCNKTHREMSFRQIVLFTILSLCGTTYNVIEGIFFPCGAAAQRGPWPAHS